MPSIRYLRNDELGRCHFAHISIPSCLFRISQKNCHWSFFIVTDINSPTMFCETSPSFSVTASCPSTWISTGLLAVTTRHFFLLIDYVGQTQPRASRASVVPTVLGRSENWQLIWRVAERMPLRSRRCRILGSSCVEFLMSFNLNLDCRLLN